jgi:hypothetical protein
VYAAARQIWLGKPLAGQRVTLRIDRTSLYVFHAGELLVSLRMTVVISANRRTNIRARSRVLPMEDPAQ